MNIGDGSALGESCGGFTLIEAVMIVVVLGILATVAIPQFGNLTGDASQSVASGVAGAAGAAAANRAAACKGGLSTDCSLGCSGILALVDAPTGTTIDGTRPSCAVHYDGKSANFKFPQ